MDSVATIAVREYFEPILRKTARQSRARGTTSTGLGISTAPVAGLFDKLSYKIEFAGLATEAVKAKVEEQKEAVKQKAKDKRQHSLKGLFGK